MFRRSSTYSREFQCCPGPKNSISGGPPVCETTAIFCRNPALALPDLRVLFVSATFLIALFEDIFQIIIPYDSKADCRSAKVKYTFGLIVYQSYC